MSATSVMFNSTLGWLKLLLRKRRDWLAAFGQHAQRCDEPGRIRDAAEDSALHRDHVDGCLRIGRISRGCAILQQPALAAYQNASAWTWVSDARADASRTPELVRRTIRKVSFVAFSGVNDRKTWRAPANVQYRGGRCDTAARQRDVIAHRVDIAARA